MELSISQVRPRRILMTADTVGGVWTYAIELARALGPYGVEVALATMGASLSDDQKREASAIANLNVYASTFKLEWMADPWQEVTAAGDWLLTLEHLVKPDLIHLNNYAHGSLAWQMPVLMVAHSCVLSWWQAVKGEAAPESWDRYRQEVEKGIQAADLLIAPTLAMLSMLKEQYQNLPETRVIANGRNASLFSRGHKEPIIFSAGRLWDEAKNLAALEKIAMRLPWKVYIAGEQQHPNGKKTRTRHLTALGQLSRSELADWYAKASIYALPARYEPFGLSILEAALSECALILGDIPSLRENWEKAALFVPPDDERALRKALERVIQDTTFRKAWAARARFRALEFTPQRMAMSYLAAYEELMSNAVWPECQKEADLCAF